LRSDSGGRRRGAAELASETPIQGSRARFEARVASTRSTRDGKANRGGSCGGDAAARADDAAARQGNSGEVARATGCTGTPTSGTGATLTSWRSSGAAPRWREDNDSAKQLRR
jgi:hypothetical protein